MPLLLPLGLPRYIYFPNQSFLGVRVREPPENLMEAPERAHNSTSCTFSVADHPVPWTVAHQAHLSMEFSRQEYWSAAISFSRGSSQQGLDPGLLHCRQILYHLSNQGSTMTAAAAKNAEGLPRASTASQHA